MLPPDLCVTCGKPIPYSYAANQYAENRMYCTKLCARRASLWKGKVHGLMIRRQREIIELERIERALSAGEILPAAGNAAALPVGRSCCGGGTRALTPSEGR